MHRLVVAIATLVATTLFGLTTAHAEKRVALVIGNEHYANFPQREQPQKAVNDARAVGNALTQIGFKVIAGENLSRLALVDNRTIAFRNRGVVRHHQGIVLGNKHLAFSQLAARQVAQRFGCRRGDRRDCSRVKREQIRAL
jgi:Caspase domain